MTHFRVVTSVSFGGGNFARSRDEDQTPKFVIYLYNEKVSKARYSDVNRLIDPSHIIYHPENSDQTEQ